MPQGSVGGVVKKDRHQTHRHPEHGIMQTNLSMIIAGHPAVIPNLMVSIDDLTGEQLQSGDQSGTEDQLHGQRNPTQQPIELSNQQKTGTPQKEHTAVAAATP